MKVKKKLNPKQFKTESKTYLCLKIEHFYKVWKEDK